MIWKIKRETESTRSDFRYVPPLNFGMHTIFQCVKKPHLICPRGLVCVSNNGQIEFLRRGLKLIFTFKPFQRGNELNQGQHYNMKNLSQIWKKYQLFYGNHSNTEIYENA